MKVLVALCLVAVVGLSLAETSLYPRGCIYINGRCYRECEVGTHGYSTACSYKTPEATCEEPNPVEDTRGKLCDYSACYCDAPTVRDTATDKCVQLDECPTKEEKEENEKEEENEEKEENED